jgi:flavodoxin
LWVKIQKVALLIYWSKTGNTERVALAIKAGLESAGLNVVIKRIEESEDVDYLEYDLVCIGSPTYQWHPPQPVDEFLKKKHNWYCNEGKVKLAAPKIAGKNALVFCTYAGPHTGINEVIPAGKYISQFLEHLGFTILDEWHVLSEYRGWKEGNTEGRMGDIRGKPDQEDLLKIRRLAEQIGKKSL